MTSGGMWMMPGHKALLFKLLFKSGNNANRLIG